MPSTKMINDAHKFVYLVGCYPEKTLPQVIALFQMSPIDINCAIWAAVELGMLSPMNEDDLHATILKTPDVWLFGDKEQELEDALTYSFQKINAEEKDMEENFLSSWMYGLAAHDVLIATKHLLERNVLHEYEIEDGENAYIFYTLKANAGKNWGTKQFKTNPLTGEKNTAEAEGTTDAATEK